MTKIDPNKPLTFKNEAQPKNLTVDFVLPNGDIVVNLEGDERYADGRFLFNPHGEYRGCITNGVITYGQGSALILENAPEKKEIFVRVSSQDNSQLPASLHREAPFGAGVGVIKLTIEDGIIKDATLERENKVPFNRIRFGTLLCQGEKL
ncbi:MAG: hypothetical protein CMB99_00225 [Flavobacteriaceae bacterium]|nr:hypothetical protein [Flavobacteriaceae bacterium]